MHNLEPWSIEPTDIPGAILDYFQSSAAASRPPGVADAEMIPLGARNSRLVSIAGAMRRQGLSATEMAPALQLVNSRRCQPSLPTAEVDRIAASVARYTPAPDPLRLTDLGNAERLAARHGHQLRYAPGRGWYAWDRRRRRRDTDGEAMRRTKETIRAIYIEAAGVEDDDQRKRIVAHARRSEAEPRLKAALALAQSEGDLVVDGTRLDREPLLLTVNNGTIDLRTGELRAHRPEDWITKFAGVEYDPDATDSVWGAFLARTTGGDGDLASFLQRAVGYTITGSTAEHKLFFAHGPGATGKTTFLEAVKGTLGEYAATSDFETFLKRRGDAGVRNDIARLEGLRLVVSVEVDEGKQFAEGLLKLISGGDTVTARYLYREAFEFQPQFKLWLAANHRPRVNADDGAMWRRIIQVPFVEFVPPAEQDTTLSQRLRTPQAKAAILAWALEGCLDWQSQGLQIPDRVRAYTEEYRAENDRLADWLADHCRFQPDAVTTAADLRDSYEQWAAANGEKPVASRTWGDSLRARGCSPDRQARLRVWRGIGFTATDR
jgi:putative DNA primase/helicase